MKSRRSSSSRSRATWAWCRPTYVFLQGLAQSVHGYGAVLIFDEVMTGFRVHPGGAQALYNIKPDLTTLGKVIGGGLPVGAYGGRRDIMQLVAPAGPMYQAGTLSGNPLAMTAGIETLKELQKPSAWHQLELRSAQLEDGLARRGRRGRGRYDVQSGGHDVHHVLYRSTRDELGFGENVRHAKVSANSFARCWSAAYIWRRRNLKRASCRWRTARQRSTRPSRQRARRFSKFAPNLCRAVDWV